MLGTLLIWLSVAVAILAIVDLFLSDSQKAWLSNAVIKTWNILDEAKGWSFADWIKKPRATWWLAVGLGLLLGSFLGIVNWLTELYLGRADDNWSWVVAVGYPLTTALILFIFSFLTRRIFAWLLKFGSLLRIAKILTVVYFVSVLIMTLIMIAIFSIGESSESPAQWIWLAILFLFLLILPLGLLTWCGLTIFVARGMAYLASGIFYIGEFIVRRIAEYPKGPVLALSALCGGIVALIKAFG
jgi:hypothetical protein